MAPRKSLAYHLGTMYIQHPQIIGFRHSCVGNLISCIMQMHRKRPRQSQNITHFLLQYFSVFVSIRVCLPASKPSHTPRHVRSSQSGSLPTVSAAATLSADMESSPRHEVMDFNRNPLRFSSPLDNEVRGELVGASPHAFPG